MGGMAPDFLSPTPIATAPSPTPFSVNNNINVNHSKNIRDQLRQQQQPSSMFVNAADTNNNNTSQMKANVSSVMGSEGKETPLTSFLRSKRGSSYNNNNMMSQAGRQQFAVPGAASLNLRTSSGVSSSSTTNPFLRHMMNNLDRSVNSNNSMQGRLGGRGLTHSARKNIMQQMSASNLASKSCKDLQRQRPSSDFYESAGIISRNASLDHIPARRSSLTAGAAKAQNRRFNLNRSNNSFGNLSKTKTSSKRDLTKLGGVNVSRSVPLKNSGSSTQSLRSEDSSGSLIPIKRGRGGRSGHDAKHKLGSGGGSSRRLSSFQNLNSSENVTNVQGRLESNLQRGSQQNHGWP